MFHNIVHIEINTFFSYIVYFFLIHKNCVCKIITKPDMFLSVMECTKLVKNHLATSRADWPVPLTTNTGLILCMSDQDRHDHNTAEKLSCGEHWLSAEFK